MLKYALYIIIVTGHLISTNYSVPMTAQIEAIKQRDPDTKCMPVSSLAML